MPALVRRKSVCACPCRQGGEGLGGRSGAKGVPAQLHLYRPQLSLLPCPQPSCPLFLCAPSLPVQHIQAGEVEVRLEGGRLERGCWTPARPPFRSCSQQYARPCPSPPALHPWVAACSSPPFLPPQPFLPVLLRGRPHHLRQGPGRRDCSLGACHPPVGAAERRGVSQRGAGHGLHSPLPGLPCTASSMAWHVCKRPWPWQSRDLAVHGPRPPPIN